MSRRLSIVILALSLSQGCAWLAPRYPVEVTVLDAESGKPIPKAKVNVDYLTKLSPTPAWSETFTDENGTTNLKVADWDGGLTQFRVSAKGYLEFESMTLPKEVLKNRKDQPRRTTIHLYRGPAPAIKIVVPKGYRGPLVIENQPTKKLIQARKGQREFQFRANSRGYVRVEATPLLLRNAWTFDRSFVEAETGKVIESQPSDDQIGARYVTSFGKVTIWAIGDQADEQKVNRRAYRPVENDGNWSHITTDVEGIQKLLQEMRQGE